MCMLGDLKQVLWQYNGLAGKVGESALSLKN